MRLLGTIASTVLIILAFGSLRAADRPNILWITSEDHGPHLGCYGDSYATTPNVDKLAVRGLTYKHCWSNAPVCAPARTTLISGLYPPSTGAEHMRSMVPMPIGKKMYPQLLRDAGYYCTNNSKEDYNLLKPDGLWDESSGKAHWRNRKPGQPFFAVFNSTKSHESQIRKKPHQLIHDPAKVRIPAYHPDTPEVREDWAQYYDKVSDADADAGVLLAEIEAAGLSEDTVVFYYADHGSGMPRSKRWPYNSGLQVPLVVHIPEKFKALRPPDYQAGGKSDRLVSFVDFAPTLLSLVGIRPPDWMQGHAFLGSYQTPPQPYVYGFRGRMDERTDCVRSVTDGRFVYIRNFRPDKIYGQHINYMWQTPTTPVWEKMFHDGKLNAAQSAFWREKPTEELYILETDRDEVNNLADSPSHFPTLEEMRSVLREHQLLIRDVGILPEGEMHRLSQSSTPYDFGHDPRFPLARILEMADRANQRKPDGVASFLNAFKDESSGVRFWAALGIQMAGPTAVTQALPVLEKAMEDQSSDVAIVAAESIARHGSPEQLERALAFLVDHANWQRHDVFTVMAALNSLTSLGEKATSALARIQQLPVRGPAPDQRYNEYVPRLLRDLRGK